MSIVNDWMVDPEKSKAVSLSIGEISKRIPLRGDWEPNDRLALAMASFRLAQEHHGAIHLLIEAGRYASANALARPHIEASLRTYWLIEKATDRQISAILKGRESEIPLLGELCASFEEQAGPAFSGRHRGLLDSLTHGGARALAGQYLEGDNLSTLNAVMMAQAGMSLSAAAYSVASRLGRLDVTDDIVRAMPIFQ